MKLRADAKLTCNPSGRDRARGLGERRPRDYIYACLVERPWVERNHPIIGKRLSGD